MRRFLLLAFVAFAAVSTLTCSDGVGPEPVDETVLTSPSFNAVPPGELVDQKHYGETAKPCGSGGSCPSPPGWCNTGSSPLLAWGQTFTPTQDNLTAIEFFVRWWRGGPYTFELWEWPGTNRTRRIATTSIANLSCGVYEWCRVAFPSPVPLTPGMKHGVVAVGHPGEIGDRAICTLVVTPHYTRGGFVAAWAEHRGPPWGDSFDAWFQTFYSPNQPPDCSAAAPSVDGLWPPNHRFVPVEVLGVTDPDGDPVTITIDEIFQDEPTDTLGDGRFTPDGQGVGTSTAEVRTERAGTKDVPGNGRVYHITFSAEDGQGGVCSGEVLVGVPHDQFGDPAVDDGALYDSTLP